MFDIFNIKKKVPTPWKKYYNDEEFNIKLPNISLYEQVCRTRLKYGDYTSYEYFGKKVSYKRFIKQIDRCSYSLKRLNLNKGDIVTICLPNVPEALILFYALNKMGVIANMLHPLSAEEEIKQSLNSTNSKYLFALDMLYSKIDNIIDSTNVIKTIFISAADSLRFYKKIPYKIMNIRKYKHYRLSKKYTNWKLFLLSSLLVDKKSITFKRFGKDTACVILHSGGTSGTPKNVVLQNRAFMLGAKQESICLKKLVPGDSCLGIMPNFHGFGLSVLMHTPLTLGCYTILVPQIDAKRFDILLKKTKPTCILGVPTLFEALTNSNNVKNLDLSFFKYIVSGGDILQKPLEDKINEYLRIHNSTVTVTQGYGMSEALAAVTLAYDDVNKSGSVGIPLPGNLIKIINPATRKIVPYGEVGEIVIHTNALMLGYLNNESETNDALQMHKDGYVWLHTGDLGLMDEDGFIFYKGRIKRMIITSGYNVYPSHIENVIESHPAVLQCTVVGMPHVYKKEVPKAFIVLKPGFHGLFIKLEIKEYCKKNLEHHMVPYKFVYRKSLPKTKLGKVDFKKLMEDDGEDDE